VATRYNIPFLLNRPGQGNHIIGEIYEVDDKMFGKLDILEDYPLFYDREIQNMKSGDEEIPCWVYFLKQYTEDVLKIPFLSEYKDSKEKPYLKGAQRAEDIRALDDLRYGIPL
jgi:gamma-glutamylaminecyclotransferase